MQAKAKLRLVAPTHQNRTMPLRPVNADLRKREYLTPHEIEKLIKAAITPTVLRHIASPGV